MLKIVAISAVALSLAACTTTERRAGAGALIGGGTGAVIGGIAGGGSGAAVGAAVGAGTGAVIGAATSPRECYARDAYGRTVIVRC
ncbi:YMGG-like glycine zipper-containing protein [Bosea sp. 117]|uniref:glycine zipper domain-containing protein n=1 Tax=Bosea sp. 117 TaxID=1125973 RepID=UPI00049453E5|nr:YMGG-like glycine zipper-containing protein [Bosea sp. 117]